MKKKKPKIKISFKEITITGAQSVSKTTMLKACMKKTETFLSKSLEIIQVRNKIEEAG